MSENLKLSTIIGLQIIFTAEQLKNDSMTRIQALYHGEEWRNKTCEKLPLLDSDDEELRNLKDDINRMHTTDDYLKDYERNTLGYLLQHHLELDENFKILNEYPLFAFKSGISLLKRWIKEEVPLEEPYAPLLSRLFKAITPKRVFCQMYDIVMKTQEPTKFIDIFDFNCKMTDMYDHFLQRDDYLGVAKYINCAIYYTIYDNKISRWTDEHTKNFLDIAQKYI